MENTVETFKNVKRVELHPATDLWMSGCRYASVVRIGQRFVHVKLDRGGKVIKAHPRNLIPLAE